MFNIIKQIFYIPLYNAFVLILAIPGIDAGMAVVLFTVIVKFALYPLQKKALLTQIKLKEVDPELKKIKNEIKDVKEQGQAILKLYKANKINPLSSFFVLLIQLPIIISLYHIFSSGTLTQINESLLYPFIHPTLFVSTTFLGLLDITQKSILTAVIAAITQFIQGQFQPMMTVEPKKPGVKPSFQDDIARSMSVQIKYILPIMIFFISFRLPAFIALYFITSNIFMVFQELLLRRHRRKLTEPVVIVESNTVKN